MSVLHMFVGQIPPPNAANLACVSLLLCIEIDLFTINALHLTCKLIYYENTNIYFENIYKYFKLKVLLVYFYCSADFTKQLKCR